MAASLEGYKDPVMLDAWLATAPVMLCLIGSAFVLFFRDTPRYQALLALVITTASSILSFMLLFKVLADGIIVVQMGSWQAPFGIVFAVDVLGALLCAISSLVGVAICIFAGQYTDSSERRFGFFTLFLLLMSGVYGAFLTGDLFNLYVWFEVMVIASFGLIVLGGRHKQLDGGVKYAFLNLLATTFFLIATGLLYGIVGTLNMADIHQKISAAPAEGPLFMVGALLITSFLMKAAVFPLSFWLPASYHTPKIVVSALFAGLLTKAGAYALIRVSVMLVPTVLYEMQTVLMIAGFATIVFGGLGAIAQSDTRRMANFLVICGIGNIIIGLALSDTRGLSGAVLYSVHSMLTMTALYLTCGLIRVSGGSYDAHRVTSLYRRDPWLAALFLGLMFSIAGLPPFSGLWAKIYLVESAVTQGSILAVLGVLLGGFFTLFALGRVWLHMFWGERLPLAVLPHVSSGRTALRHKNGIPFLAAVSMLIASLLLGLLPGDLIETATLGANGLLNPEAYITTVLPEASGGH